MRYSGMTFIMSDINGNGHNVRQVTKSKAKKAYENGGCVWMHPCDMRINNAWQTPYPRDNSDGDSFEKVVSEYSYFNCNKDFGRYPIFFIETD